MKVRVYILFFICSVTSIYAQQDDHFARNYNVKVGQPCPEVVFGLVDGSTIKISDFIKNTVLIYFWTNESDTSVKILPHLMNLQKKYGRFHVIAVNDGKMNLDSLIKFVAAKKFKFAMALDNNRFLYKTLAGGNKYGYPFSLLIDREGNVEKINTNYREVEKILEKNNVLLKLKNKLDKKKHHGAEN